jgi:uncharacterized DUF497 family protein
VRIIWDEPKRRANLVKHGMDFADLDETFFADALISGAKKNRWRAIGVNLNGVIAVVFAKYGAEAISVISMRPAKLMERKLFDAYLKES